MPLLILVCEKSVSWRQHTSLRFARFIFPGVLNSDADVLSRWNVPSRAKEQFLHRVQRDQLIAVSVPINFFQLDSPF